MYHILNINQPIAIFNKNNNQDQDNDKTTEHIQEDTQVLKQTEAQNQIVSMGSVTQSDGKHCIHCLTIIGQIEGHFVLPPQNKSTKYEHVLPQLVAIEEDPAIDGLLMILNTVGGDVEAGLAIAELVSGISKPTVSLVLGGGHSIGVPLAVSAKYSFIAPSASMTIHPVRMNGTILGVPQTFYSVDKIQDRIVNFIIKKSTISETRLRELMMNKDELVMDVGSVIVGEQAVDEGLIHETGTLSDALKKLHCMIDKNKDENDKDSKENKLDKSNELESNTNCDLNSEINK